MYSTLLTSIENKILTIQINRPDKLNALNQQVFQDLDNAIDEAEKNSAVSSIIITGAGEKSFVAGADIMEFLSVADGEQLARNGQEVFFKIEHASKPVVAAVNGFALGGGCELAMACHFRVASDKAKFGQPEVNLGLIPGYGGTQRLTQLIGKGRALELLMTGNMINAETALQYGLVNYVVPSEELINKTTSLLNIINKKAPVAISECIKAVNAAMDFSQNGFEAELQGFGKVFKTDDMKEGTNAFLEKRAAIFKGN
jgi:enoyl-CoA hydratase